MRRARPSALPFLFVLLLLVALPLPATAPPDETQPVTLRAPVVLRDVDADGDRDLIVRGEIWINEGEGRFALALPLDPGRKIVVGIPDLDDEAGIAAMFADADEGPAKGVTAGTARGRLAERAAAPRDGIAEAMAITDSPHERYLCLDGVDDQGAVSDNASLDLGTGDGEDFTIETFFYVPEPDVQGTDKLLWKDQSWGLQVIYNSSFGGVDRIFFRVWTSAIAQSNVYSDIADLSEGWHHLAAVYDNQPVGAGWDGLYLFLDGVQLSTVPSGSFNVSPGINNSQFSVTVGNGWPVDPTAPGMDEVRFSDVIRYGGSYAVPSPFTSDGNTRALWHFDEFPGTTTFADSSSNGNTLTGANGAATCGLACLPITVSPASLPEGAVDAAYSETLGASGGTGPYTFAVTSGSLPPGLGLSAGGTISGTPTLRGSYSFDVTATDASQCTGTKSYVVEIIAAFGPPPELVATATSTSSVFLEWAPVNEAIEYEVWRSTSIATAYAFVDVSMGTTYTDSSGLAANTTYLYKVRAVSGTTTSAFSAIDAATTIVFTDPVPSTVRAGHINQLRTAVDAMLFAADRPPGSYTTVPMTAGTTIDADHVTQLRAGLDTARSFIGLGALSYTDPALAPGVIVKEAHVTELRAGTQ